MCFLNRRNVTAGRPRKTPREHCAPTASVSVVSGLAAQIDRLVDETNFVGVVRVDRSAEGSGEPETVVRAAGLADRAHAIAMTPDTQLCMASGSKVFTALAVMSLVEQGVLTLSTTARSILGDDLPLIEDDVTVEHLLAHRSGIGDYLDEYSDLGDEDYPMPVPVHRLADTEQFVAVLGGYPTKFPTGERFAYCNGGYVVLALIAERASGTDFHDLVRERVCAPAGLRDTDFLRTDELPGRAAIGYLQGDDRSRTNVLHLPVLATGDGGMYTTVDDMHRFWSALLAGRIVPEATVAEMIRPHSSGIVDDDQPETPGYGYGLGFWRRDGSDAVMLEGMDAGVSFRSVCLPSQLHDRQGLTYTVISNSTYGAWPLARALATAFAAGSETADAETASAETADVQAADAGAVARG